MATPAARPDNTEIWLLRELLRSTCEDVGTLKQTVKTLEAERKNLADSLTTLRVRVNAMEDDLTRARNRANWSPPRNNGMGQATLM